MRILLLTHYFEPENGAPQRRWTALIERFCSAGHEVRVVAPPPHYPSGRVRPEHRSLGVGRSHTSATGAAVVRTAYFRHSGDLFTRTVDHLVAAIDGFRRASRSIASHGAPDVIIATAPALESLIAGRLVARRFSVPLVAEMRDAWPDLVAHTPGLVSPGQPTAVAKRWVHEFVTRLQRSADGVVTTTATFAEVLASRGIRRIHVLRNGTELDRYRAVSIEPRRDGGPLRVLYMGTIGRSQGLDRLIEAAARMRARGGAVELRIVGQGADVGRLRRLNARLGSPAVILGQVDGAAVMAQYAWADSTVVSLRDWEPFSWTVPSKLYELLAAGKHITAIVAGESAAIVREARAGDVVPPGDVEELVTLWMKLSSDPSGLQVGEGGRRWVEEHADFDRIASDYLVMLETIVQEHAASAAPAHGERRGS